MKRILVFSFVLLLLGCSSVRHNVEYSGLPKCGVAYLENLGLKCDDVSVIRYEEANEYSSNVGHTVGAMLFRKQKKGWFVNTKDSVRMFFDNSGRWQYSVTLTQKDEIPERYYASVDNVEFMLETIREENGRNACIGGISKEKGLWVIAAYPQKGVIYLGPPMFYYFTPMGICKTVKRIL